MFFVFVQGWRVVQVNDQPIDPRAYKAINQFLKNVQMLALAFVDDRSQHHDALIRHVLNDLINHLADGLGVQRQIVGGAAGFSYPCKQQSQVVVDFGNRANR